MEQQNKGTKEQRNKGTKEQRNIGTKEQRNKGTKKQKVRPFGSCITRSPGLAFYKVAGLVGGVSVINGAYPSSLFLLFI